MVPGSVLRRGLGRRFVPPLCPLLPEVHHHQTALRLPPPEAAAGRGLSRERLQGPTAAVADAGCTPPRGGARGWLPDACRKVGGFICVQVLTFLCGIHNFFWVLGAGLTTQIPPPHTHSSTLPPPANVHPFIRTFPRPSPKVHLAGDARAEQEGALCGLPVHDLPPPRQVERGPLRERWRDLRCFGGIKGLEGRL